MKNPWLSRIIFGCFLVILFASQWQSSLVKRAYNPALSRSLAEESYPDLSKRGGGFRKGITKLCNLCEKDQPTEEDEQAQPPREVELQPVGSPVYQLWKSIPDGQIASTGGVAGGSLDMSTPARYGATQIYGCTVVIILDGRGVFIGHYPQIDSMGGITMDDAATADLEIIVPLERAMAERGTIEFTTEAKVWVVHNIPRYIHNRSVAQYTERRPGWQAIVKLLTEDYGVQRGNIRSQPYQSTVPEATNQLGKVVVDWIPMTDGANLNVYFNSETPVRYVYDADGNNCRLDPEGQPNGIAKI